MHSSSVRDGCGHYWAMALTQGECKRISLDQVVGVLTLRIVASSLREKDLPELTIWPNRLTTFRTESYNEVQVWRFEQNWTVLCPPEHQSKVLFWITCPCQRDPRVFSTPALVDGWGIAKRASEQWDGFAVLRAELTQHSASRKAAASEMKLMAQVATRHLLHACLCGTCRMAPQLVRTCTCECIQIPRTPDMTCTKDASQCLRK